MRGVHQRIGMMVGMLCVGMAASAWAASVGLPEGSSDHPVAVTVEYTQLLGRDLRAPTGETADISMGHQGHARISYALLDALQPYVKLGAAEFDQAFHNTNVVGLGRRNIDLDYDWGFSWGAGVSGLYYLDRYPVNPSTGFFIGYAGEYLTSSNELGAASMSGAKATRVAGRARFEEWYGAGFGGYTWELDGAGETPWKLTAYAGGRYSDLRVTYKGLEFTVPAGTISNEGHERGKDRAGVFVGLAAQAGDHWRVNVEGRFIDEEAVTARATAKF